MRLQEISTFEHVDFRIVYQTDSCGNLDCILASTRQLSRLSLANDVVANDLTKIVNTHTVSNDRSRTRHVLVISDFFVAYIEHR